MLVVQSTINIYKYTPFSVSVCIGLVYARTRYSIEPVRICFVTVVTKMENKIHQLQLQAVNESWTLHFISFNFFYFIVNVRTFYSTHTFTFIDWFIHKRPTEVLSTQFAIFHHTVHIVRCLYIFEPCAAVDVSQ